MALASNRPLTPGQRFLVRNKQELSKKRPEKDLVESIHNPKGRNCYGRITSRRRGGGHKSFTDASTFVAPSSTFPRRLSRSNTIRTVPRTSRCSNTPTAKRLTFLRPTV